MQFWESFVHLIVDYCSNGTAGAGNTTAKVGLLQFHLNLFQTNILIGAVFYTYLQVYEFLAVISRTAARSLKLDRLLKVDSIFIKQNIH